MLNRGITNTNLFREVDHRVGDRDGGLAVLGDDRWDVVVDTRATPRVVRDSASLLATRTGWYSLVSSLAVYADLSVHRLGEEAPLAPPPDPASEDIGSHYGPLKAQCEGVVAQLYPRRSTITRCSIIVGPNDPTHRFTYWIARAAQGGTMFAPGHPSQKVQSLDRTRPRRVASARRNRGWPARSTLPDRKSRSRWESSSISVRKSRIHRPLRLATTSSSRTGAGALLCATDVGAGGRFHGRSR